MSRAEIVIRVVSYLALIAGVPAVLVFGWIVFVPGEAVCDGAAMSPGQTCALPFAQGDSYDAMVQETTVRRAIGYVAWGLAAIGVVGVPAVELYRRGKGPAPEPFTPEVVLGDKPGHIAPEHLERAMTRYALRVAELEQRLGPDHPDPLTWRYHLANTMVLAGEPARALPLYETVAAGRERALGADHRDTLAARTGIAYAHALGDEPARAIPLGEELLVRAERRLPPRDRLPDTLRRILDLARDRTADDV